MQIIFLILLVIILILSWANWRLLLQWFPNSSLRYRALIYWLITGLSWLLISYNGIFRPASPFFYQWISPLVNLSFVWALGQIMLLLLFPFLFALRRIMKNIYSQKNRERKGLVASRRTFLQTMLYAAPVLSLGVSAKGVYSAQKEMVVRHLTLDFQGLPKDLQGFKIAQISDTHLGPFFSLARLDEVIELIIQEKPDVVVITGDLIDELNLLEPAIRKLSHLFSQVPYGIYFCWGNHEYFRDINRIRKELEKSPIHVLENSNMPITVGETTFYILGVDYPWPKSAAEKDSTRRQFMLKAEANIPNNAFKVLLAHHPDFLFDGFSAQIPLTLSGHTHGGQVNILGKSLLPVTYYYMRGLYQEGHSYGYVSPGAGQWIPFRLGCPPEISIFTLKES